ncbi:sugar phosphate isomerase/epimerase family protein [Paenibacillus sp. NPDC093718]|uniref:sugar phosphate isomerase/epimerase family protein n=1 Tax=Paenibacillus sp. NPDC093718 TaxID=3390601 RepID=UPI003CFD9FBA
MQTRGIGVSLAPNESVGNLELLKKKLEKINMLGFDCVEIPIQGMKLIRNGCIDESRLLVYIEALKQFPLHYTTHAPFNINLFRSEDRNIDRLGLMASLEITGAIGAETMVYHVGRYVGEETFLYSHQWPVLNDGAKERLMAEERAVMRDAGQRAAELNVRIGMENMRPYLDCPDYCYSVYPHLLAEQVRTISHPNVGITLDTGHAFLASRMYGLDLQAEIEAIRPYIVHMHVHDNFGRACYSTEKNQNELLVLGRGDMHAPIGDGAIPVRDLLGWLGGSVDGYFVHELREIYESQWPTLTDRLKRMEYSSYASREAANS